MLPSPSDDLMIHISWLMYILVALSPCIILIKSTPVEGGHKQYTTTSTVATT